MNYYQTYKDILISNGYIPIPIIPGDKRPAVKGWADKNYTPPQGYGGYGIGIQCGNGTYPIVGIDCDVMDESLSNKVLDWCLETFGETVYRIGRAPKVMIIYRANVAGIRKITSGGCEVGHVEIWGFGEQFVAFGRHPDTKKEYYWPGVLGDLLNVRAEQLPVVDAEQLKAATNFFISEAVAAGYSFKKQETQTAISDYDPEDPLDRVSPIGLSRADAEKCLLDLDPDCGRDEWRNIGMALHHEFSGSNEGFVVWDEWSAKGKKYKSGETEVQWASFGKYTGRPITAAYLLKLSKKGDIWEKKDFFSSLDWSTTRFSDDPPPLPMVVHNFLPKGVVSLFYSAGGAGKSTLMFYAAIKIAIAKHFETYLFSHSIVGGKVVILTAEDPEIILNRRFIGLVNAVAAELSTDFKDVRKAVDENLYVLSTFGNAVQLFKLKDNGTILPTAYYSSLLSSLKTINDLQLVIVDTKTRFSPGEGSGNVTATQEINYYEAIALETGASVMLLHHSNKSSRDGSQTGATAYRDATALFDSVRAAWYLRSLKDDELAVNDLEGKKGLLLENSKNNYILPHDDLILVRDGYSYSVKKAAGKLSKSELKERKHDYAYDKIIDILQNASGQSCSQTEVVKACKEAKVSYTLIKVVLEHLIDDGLIEKGGSLKRFNFSLTEEGKKYGLEIK